MKVIDPPTCQLICKLRSPVFFEPLLFQSSPNLLKPLLLHFLGHLCFDFLRILSSLILFYDASMHFTQFTQGHSCKHVAGQLKPELYSQPRPLLHFVGFLACCPKVRYLSCLQVMTADDTVRPVVVPQKLELQVPWSHDQIAKHAITRGSKGIQNSIQQPILLQQVLHEISCFVLRPDHGHALARKWKHDVKHRELLFLNVSLLHNMNGLRA
mmetsp:Transcript_32328/g.72628  ORF Transcript_32328/g.72628 Transcript_32328/m.72628 type:complete len:212 (-) Transcript_32328:663-1298(-)